MLSVILCITLFYSIIILTGNTWDEIVYIIIGFPTFFGSMILSALLCSKTKIIEIIDGILSVDKSRQIKIDQIDWYNEEQNFLFDGIAIKTKQKKKFFFITIKLFHKNTNFQIFKDILINKTLDHRIPEKTTKELYSESKFLYYGTTFLMLLVIAAVIVSLLTDFKLDGIKLFYMSMLSLGLFIMTRK
jgi:hypothetical protein